ncbi:MAG: alpha/beta hydrolase [Bacteroidetes bacterium]|nr:alpha/beta hydrolase [Bacteroidota bacterium]
MQHGSTGQVQVMDIDLDSYQYPYPVHFLQLSIQKGTYKMAYMDVQPQHPNGESIVLLHGKNFNGAYWGETAKTLSEKGYRVIIPDQIGFGKSSKPEHFQYSFEQLAKNTKSLLDTLGIKKTIILGHSMGGMLATRFTLMYPEMTAKLILADPIGLEDYGAMVPYQGVDARYKAELTQTYDKLKEYELKSYYHNEWKPDYDEWLNVYAGWIVNKDYARIAWNAALTYDMIMTQPVCHEFGNIKVPTLLIIGQSDSAAVGKEYASEQVKKAMGNYPKLGKETHAKIRNSQLVELAGVGHLPHVEAFDKFIKAVEEFLKK